MSVAQLMNAALFVSRETEGRRVSKKDKYETHRYEGIPVEDDGNGGYGYDDGYGSGGSSEYYDSLEDFFRQFQN